MNFIRSHPEAFAIGYLLLSLVCGVLAARVIAYGEREVPVVETFGQELTRLSIEKAERQRIYDRERDVDPGDGYMGSEAHNSGHGAHYGRF